MMRAQEIITDILDAAGIRRSERRMALARQIVDTLQANGIRVRDTDHDFTPCSPRHKHCSRHHAELVEQFREHRHREELTLEKQTGRYRGDLKLWRENGGARTSFKHWLKAQGTNDD